MEVTWLGALFFPLGMLFFFTAPRWLHALTIFSIPFTAASLLNTGAGVPVTPVIFFGSLFVASQILDPRLGSRIAANGSGDRSLLLLFIFCFVVMLSMVMPLIIDGDLRVSSNRLNDLYDYPIELNEHNVKNPLPVIFFVILTVFLVFRNDSLERIKSTMRIYVASATFVSLWGMFQFSCNNILAIKYPYYIFNNAIIDSMKGYEQLIDINGMEVPRVSSVMHEPSILSKYLLTAVPIMLVTVLMKHPLFGWRQDKVILFLLMVTLVLTTSSTAYYGIVVAMTAALVLLGRFHAVGRRWGFWVVMGFIALCAAYFFIPMVGDVVTSTIFQKMDSGSASERYLSIVNSWGYFLEYPVLGLGWAMVTSHDLVVNLLANTGAVGLAAFVVLQFYVIRRSLRTLRKSSVMNSEQNKDVFVLAAGLIISLVTLLITGLFTGVEFYLGYFYFILGMIISLNKLAIHKNNQEDCQYT